MEVDAAVGGRVPGFGSVRALEAQRESARVSANAASRRDVRGGAYRDGAPVSGPSEMVAAEQRTLAKALQVQQQQPVQQAARARTGGGATPGEAGGAALYGRNGRLQPPSEQAPAGASATVRAPQAVARVAESTPIRLASPAEGPLPNAGGNQLAPASAPVAAVERQIALRRDSPIATSDLLEGRSGAEGVRNPQSNRASAGNDNDATRRERADRMPAPEVERSGNERSDAMRERLIAAYQLVPQATPASISLRA